MRAPHGQGLGEDGVDFVKVGLGERDVGRRGGSVELGRPACAHDGDVHGGIGQCPGDRQLNEADVPLPC